MPERELLRDGRGSVDFAGVAAAAESEWGTAMLGNKDDVEMM